MQDLGVGLLGSVDSGKSTCIGCFTTHEKDNGNGKSRSLILRHPHEISSGRTSDTSYHVGTFGNNRITFMDLCGHEKYLKTTIHGLGAFLPDLVCLCVDRYTPTYRITREHLGLALRMKIPFAILMTKVDLYDKEITNHSLDQLKDVVKKSGNRKTHVIKNSNDISLAMQGRLIPVFHISNVTHQGYELLFEYFARLQKNTTSLFTHPKKFMIDRDYRIRGIGLVVTGFNGGDPISVGDKMHLGNGIEVHIRSIHDDFRNNVETLPSGVRGCLNVRCQYERIRPGSVLSHTPVNLVSIIDANVEILSTHHTTIRKDYHTVIHCGTVRRPAKVINEQEVCFRGGSRGILRFKLFTPAYLEVGQSIFFREGKLIGDGQIVKIE